MNKALILLFTLILNSCIKSDDPIDINIPTCIQNIIDDPTASRDIKTVKVQEVKNELHYWLNTDETLKDGPEYIVNLKCDTICIICGECFIPDCAKKYRKSWTNVWTK